MRLLIIAVFLLGLSAKVTADEKIGDWTISLTDDGGFAYTQSDSGGRFGIICLPGSECQYFVNVLLACEDGAKTPVLIAGEAGTLASNSECVPLEKVHILAIEASLDDVVFASGSVGVATAMADGKFKVLRFSMKGAVPAIAKAKSHMEKHKKPADDGLSDTVL